MSLDNEFKAAERREDIAKEWLEAKTDNFDQISSAVKKGVKENKMYAEG